MLHGADGHPVQYFDSDVARPRSRPRSASCRSRASMRRRAVLQNRILMISLLDCIGRGDEDMRKNLGRLLAGFAVVCAGPAYAARSAPAYYHCGDIPVPSDSPVVKPI